jgi:hypothetical protein
LKAAVLFKLIAKFSGICPKLQDFKYRMIINANVQLIIAFPDNKMETKMVHQAIFTKDYLMNFY